MQCEAVAYLQAEHSLSERRACQVVGADRTMIRYRSQRAPETVLRGRLRDLVNERRRFRYRRLFMLLRREGGPLGINRIYREEGLTVRKRNALRKAVGTRAQMLTSAAAAGSYGTIFQGRPLNAHERQAEFSPTLAAAKHANYHRLKVLCEWFRQ